MVTFHRELLDVVPFEVYKVCSALLQVDLTLETYVSEEGFGVVIRAGEVFEFNSNSWRLNQKTRMLSSSS